MIDLKEIESIPTDGPEYKAFLKKIKASKKGLTDREVAIYGLLYEPDRDFREVLECGTAKDLENVIPMKREAVETGKKLRVGEIMHEGVYDSPPRFNSKFFFSLG